MSDKDDLRPSTWDAPPLNAVPAYSDHEFIPSAGSIATAPVCLHFDRAPGCDSHFDIKVSNLRTAPTQTVLLMDAFNDNGAGFDNSIMLFDAAQPPEKQDHLGIWHANVGTMTFFDSHAGTMTWKQYTNAVTGMEKAKQFFGGTINFYWN